jgi:hypothetical protein
VSACESSSQSAYTGIDDAFAIMGDTYDALRIDVTVAEMAACQLCFWRLASC